MKKTLLLIFSSLVLFGCSKELTEAPIVTSIQLNKSDLTLQIGESYAFKVTYKSETAKQPEYKWSTSNQSVLSVTSNGEIKALSVGNAKLIVRTTDTGIADTCNVIVSPILVTSFTLSCPSTEFEVNQTMTISATYTPSNATYKKLLFESSDITVATVKDSIITAKAAGNTTIKATTMDGSNITRSFNLVVKELPLTINATSISLVSTKTFSLVVSPNADGCTYESENSYIASVSSNGLITAKIVGKTIIHAKNANKNLDATCEVTVTPQYNMFREPSLEFGATPATIKGYEKRVLASETTTGLIYTGENSYLTNLIYSFENSAYTSSGCLVLATYSSLLSSYIGERYVYIGTSDDFIMYLSTDSKTLVALKLAWQGSTAYWVALFGKSSTDTKLSSPQSYSILLKKMAPIVKSMKVQMPVR